MSHLTFRVIIFIAVAMAALSTIYIFFGSSAHKQGDIWFILFVLAVGVLATIPFFLLSLFLSRDEIKQRDRFNAMGVLNVLSSRKDMQYYSKYLINAREIVQVKGTSCSRFIDDYANENNADHVFLDAMRNNPNLKGEFFIPQEEHMESDSRENFNKKKLILKQIYDEFPERIVVRRFDFPARYSLVRVDDHMIVGPVFDGIDSRNTPAIHINVNSVYAEKYIENLHWLSANSQEYTFPDEKKGLKSQAKSAKKIKRGTGKTVSAGKVR